MTRDNINNLLQILKGKTIDSIQYVPFLGADHNITIICTDATQLEVQWNDNEGGCTLNNIDIQ